MLPVMLAQFPRILQFPLGILLFIVSLFLILLILVQRGRGGGLTGALGGMGGQSAFGSKAGDLFTRVTVVVACVWIFLCLLIIVGYNSQGFGGSPRNRRAPVEDSQGQLGSDDTGVEAGAGSGAAEGGTDGGATGSSATSGSEAGGDAAP